MQIFKLSKIQQKNGGIFVLRGLLWIGEKLRVNKKKIKIAKVDTLNSIL